MVSSGVESLRVSIDWAYMQPYKSWSQVPAADKSQFSSDGVDGVPTRFGNMDALLGAAAARGLSVLPTVVDAPRWDGSKPKYALIYVPKSYAPYGRFFQTLIRRYGPKGSFWNAGGRRVAIRTWQVWNEPNEFGYWPHHQWASSYVSMLRTAHNAIKSADRGAKVLLAGLSNYSWKYLGQIYNVKGARSLFDVVGVHPYTKFPQGVITILSNARNVMKRHGDARKPLDADEMGWPSSVGQTSSYYGFETTESGQAQNIAAVLPLLARNRARLGLGGFYYYTWAGIEHHDAYTFDFSGLLRYESGNFVAKPGLAAFQRGALALEGCSQKSAVASVCAKPG